jgi:hypothetical protein
MVQKCTKMWRIRHDTSYILLYICICLSNGQKISSPLPLQHNFFFFIIFLEPKINNKKLTTIRTFTLTICFGQPSLVYKSFNSSTICPSIVPLHYSLPNIDNPLIKCHLKQPQLDNTKQRIKNCYFFLVKSNMHCIIIMKIMILSLGANDFFIISLSFNRGSSLRSTPKAQRKKTLSIK